MHCVPVRGVWNHDLQSVPARQTAAVRIFFHGKARAQLPDFLNARPPDRCRGGVGNVQQGNADAGMLLDQRKHFSDEIA